MTKDAEEYWDTAPCDCDLKGGCSCCNQTYAEHVATCTESDCSFCLTTKNKKTKKPL